MSKKDCLQIALHFLKFRPRSVFEIEKKLKEKKISEKEIADTVKVLKRNKLLDDAEFAKMWVRDRNRFKPSGSFVLRFELKKFGVSESDIESSLIDQDEEELAKQALVLKLRYRNADFAKQAAFLQRRGFKVGTILKILNHK